jgi:hypothetical protein
MADPLDEALRPHLERAWRLIDSRMADARSHARTGMFPLAAQRLVDLHHGLLRSDGAGLVGDSFAEFYRDSWRHDPHDADLHDPAMREPVADGAMAARTAPIMGNEPAKELALHVERARYGLMAATAGTVHGIAHDEPSRLAAIDTWHEQHSAVLKGWARGTLSNGQMALHAATGYLRLKPEFRDGQ